MAPKRPECVALGIECTVQVLVTVGDDPDLMKSEAAFTMHCAVGPGWLPQGRTTAPGSTAPETALHTSL